jgi:hypothetical protein
LEGTKVQFMNLAQGKTDIFKRLKGWGESSGPEHRRAGQLGTEDFVILCLSVILVVATVWLAIKVL